VEWLDEPWPERVLKQLWKELKVTRRCEARANEALHDALESSDTATLARVALQEEVNRTKHVAHLWHLQEEGCRCCDRQDQDDEKYLIYCLLRVIVFLLVAIVFKAK
jgi:hypothetical protein